MFREKIPARQLSAWLFSAMVPVGIQLLCGSAWTWAGIAGLLGLLLAYPLWHRHRETTKWESIILFIYVSILMGQLLRPAAQSWPVGSSDPAVPLILLALAAWSAQKGPSAAARVGAVLFWVVLGLYGVIFAAGAEDVKVYWLKPQWNTPDALAMVVFLIPAASISLLKESAVPGKWGWLSIVYILLGAMITVGVLSPKLAAETSNAFFEMSRSLDLLGVARRFEALICAGTTVGWFALLSLLLSLCGSYSQKSFHGMGKLGVWTAAGAAAVLRLCGLHINPTFLLFVGAVFWVVVPLTTQGLEKIKKS